MRKKLHEEEKLIGNIPGEILIEVMSGFQGIQQQYKNIHIPHKKPKGGELIATATPLKSDIKSISG